MLAFFFGGTQVQETQWHWIYCKSKPVHGRYTNNSYEFM